MCNPTDQIIKDILDLQPCWTSENTSAMQRRGKLLRHDLVREIRELVQGTEWSVEGSDGRGLKSRVPWVRIFDPSTSPKATAGWYLVYLFRTDGSAVYLSLTQGTTDYVDNMFRPKDRLEIRRTTEIVRSSLRSAVNSRHDVSSGIELRGSGGLGDGYEVGTAVAIRYDRATIPSSSSLRQDLAWMLELLARVPSPTHLSIDTNYAHLSRPTASSRFELDETLEGSNTVDKIQQFIAGFALAVESHAKQQQAQAVLSKIEQSASLLAELLVALEEFQRAPVAVTVDDLSRLRAELVQRDPVELGEFIPQAEAMLKLITDGVLDGNARQLQELTERARIFVGVSTKSASRSQRSLPNPARVTCIECNTLIAGIQAPSINRKGLWEGVRRHDVRQHGGYDDSTRAGLVAATPKLMSGARTVDVGRYRIEVIDD